MGFFDYMMRGIGFETEDAAPATKKRLKKAASGQETENYAPASFSLPVYDGSGDQDSPQGPNIQYEASGMSIPKNVIVYNPKTQSDIKNLVDFLRRKEPIIVNFGFLPQQVSNSMISFISGALYALRGSIHPIAGDLYLLTPEGVNILVPKEVK